MEHDESSGLRERLKSSGEEALGRLAQDLLENPLVTGAISRAFEAREKVSAAQEVTFGALNLPSAADLERLTRRVRSLSQRLEGIEDGVDRLDGRLAKLGQAATDASADARLGAMESGLAALTREIAALREALPDAAQPVPASQERLAVGHHDELDVTEGPPKRQTKPIGRPPATPRDSKPAT
jgi:hypothetical protein